MARSPRPDGRCSSKIASPPWAAPRRFSPWASRAWALPSVSWEGSGPTDRALVSFLGAIASLRVEDVPDSALRAFGHLHVSSYFLQQGLQPRCPDLFARARAAGLTTSLDPGCDPADRWGSGLVEDLLPYVDVFLPNERELRALAHTSSTVEALWRLESGRTRIVVKRGASGCATLMDGGLLEIPSFPVDPVDTTGAGDSFDAGFLHAWLAGRPLRDCLRWGTACAGLSTRGLGGTARQASPQEAEQLLATSS